MNKSVNRMRPMQASEIVGEYGRGKRVVDKLSLAGTPHADTWAMNACWRFSFLLLATTACDPSTGFSAPFPRTASDIESASPLLLTTTTSTLTDETLISPQYATAIGQQCSTDASPVKVLVRVGCSTPGGGGGVALFAVALSRRRSQAPSSPAQRRTRAIIAATINTVALGAVGSFLAFGKLNDDGSPEPALRATGVGVLALGVGIDLALLPSIFAKQRADEAFAYPP
jgi:hypothetical protein